MVKIFFLLILFIQIIVLIKSHDKRTILSKLLLETNCNQFNSSLFFQIIIIKEIDNLYINNINKLNLQLTCEYSDKSNKSLFYELSSYKMNFSFDKKNICENIYFSFFIGEQLLNIQNSIVNINLKNKCPFYKIIDNIQKNKHFMLYKKINDNEIENKVYNKFPKSLIKIIYNRNNYHSKLRKQDESDSGEDSGGEHTTFDNTGSGSGAPSDSTDGGSSSPNPEKSSSTTMIIILTVVSVVSIIIAFSCLSLERFEEHSTKHI